MNQLSEEQQERVRQIREIVSGPNYYHEGRFYKSRYDNYLLGDALLLLQECVTLLDSDSQAAGNGIEEMPSVLWISTSNDRSSGFDAHVHKHRDNDARYLLGVQADISYVDALRDATLREKNAATTMRNNCAEKVKEVRDQLAKEWGAHSYAVGAVTRALAAIESLTLDQVKPGEM